MCFYLILQNNFYFSELFSIVLDIILVICSNNSTDDIEDFSYKYGLMGSHRSPGESIFFPLGSDSFATTIGGSELPIKN